jgi:hypothetical protein
MLNSNKVPTTKKTTKLGKWFYFYIQCQIRECFRFDYKNRMVL